MARWRHAFIYNGPHEAAFLFGHRFQNGQRVVVALDQWNRGLQRHAERAGLTYLGLVDIRADAVEPTDESGADVEASVPHLDEPVSSKTTIKIKKGRGYRGSY